MQRKIKFIDDDDDDDDDDDKICLIIRNHNSNPGSTQSW